MICRHVWNETEAVPLRFIRETFGIDRVSLEAWNCFLESSDRVSVPDVGYCVEAVTEQTAFSSPPAPTASTYNYSTWPTVTIPHETHFTAAELESETDVVQRPGDIFLKRTQNDTAPYLPNFNGKSIGYPFACDDEEGLEKGGAEICHKTRFCHSENDLPTCVDGDCRCKPTFCSKTSECRALDLCRDMDQRAECDIGSKFSVENDKDGTCVCKPKYTDCADNGKHAYCAEKFNCSSWSHDVYRLPTCVDGPGRYESSCECRTTQCTYGNWWNQTAISEDASKGDVSVCEGLQCPYDTALESEQELSCQWDESSSLNGTCYCWPVWR